MVKQPSTDNGEAEALSDIGSVALWLLSHKDSSVEHSSNSRRCLSHTEATHRALVASEKNTSPFDHPFMFHYQSLPLIAAVSP